MSFYVKYHSHHLFICLVALAKLQRCSQRKPAHPTLCSRAVNRGWDTSRHPSTFICSLAHKAARYATDASSDIISGVFICAVSLTPPFYFCSLVHKASMFATDASSPQSVLTRSRLKSGYITAFLTLFALSRIKQRGTQQTPTRTSFRVPLYVKYSHIIVGLLSHASCIEVRNRSQLALLSALPQLTGLGYITASFNLYLLSCA